jgi:hypothetical protein
MSKRLGFAGLILAFLVAGATLTPAAPDKSAGPKALARARLELARSLYEASVDEMKNAPPAEGGARIDALFPAMDRLSLWSRRWMEAERDASEDKAGVLAALEAHVKRLKTWEDVYEEAFQAGLPSTTRIAAGTLKFYRLEAEFQWAVARQAP